MGSEAKRKWLKCQFWVNCSFELPCHRVTLSGIVVVVELRPQHRAIATLPLMWSGVLQDRGVGEGPGRAGGGRGGVEEKNTYFTAESVSEESAGNGLDCGASIVIVFLCYLLSSCSNVCFYSQ